MRLLTAVFWSAVLLCPAMAALAAAPQAEQFSATAMTAALARFDSSPAPMGHPRLFGGAPDAAGIVAAARAERASALAALADYLKRHAVRLAAPALPAQARGEDAGMRMASWWQQDRLLQGIAESAFVWYVTGDDWFFQEMRERMKLFGNALLARRCRGDVFETRDYAWYFALGYDFTAARMDAGDRQLVHDVLLSCAGAGLGRAPTVFLDHPDNPIAFNALGKAIGAMLIVRGDMPDAAAGLEAALAAYVPALSPWGGADGGFANGSSYALWDASESMPVWDLLSRMLIAPVYDKPWLANLPRFIAYTLPPGTPAGAFGDGAELRRQEEWARLGKAIALRSGGALARWYARQLQGGDPARLQALLSPRLAGAVAPLPRSQPDSASFPSVGVVAMHSGLADPQRVSVLFRSSPFGSLNHAHADQNSFVLYAKGEVLAMDSGLYDAYASPHWRQWYKQTRAHNAITFDGAQGQDLGKSGLGQRSASGHIVRFRDRRRWALVAGEAAQAYGEGVRQARRTLVYLRPATLFVIDQLASAQPRKWEWNLHTGAPLAGSPAAFTTQAGAVRLCGVVAARDPLELLGASGYVPAPSQPAGPHYWSRFAYRQAARTGLFVAVLRVDCAQAAPQIRFGAQGATIRTPGMAVSVGKDGVTARPAPSTGAAGAPERHRLARAHRRTIPVRIYPARVPIQRGPLDGAAHAELCRPAVPEAGQAACGGAAPALAAGIAAGALQRCAGVARQPGLVGAADGSTRRTAAVPAIPALPADRPAAP